MTDLPDSPRPSDEMYERKSATGIPRWVKVSGIVVLLLALVVVLAMLVGGGEHGPSRHGSGGLGPVTPSSVAAVHVPPEGGHG